MVQGKPNAKSAAPPSRSPISRVLARCRGAFIAIGLVSGLINILMLTGSLFMMQVYDRVLSSQSVPTLIALSAVAVGAYFFQGILEVIRSRVLALIGERVDLEVGPKVHAALVELPLASPRQHDPLLPFRDLEAIRAFLSGPGPSALFDLPWIPVYLLIAYLLHPVLGVLSLFGALFLVVLTVFTELRTKGPSRDAQEAFATKNMLAEASHRGAEVIRAMGLLPRLEERWRRAHEAHLTSQRQANFVIANLTSVARSTRFMLQSAVLGAGAYLAIKGEISGGAIIAASILSSRALAPVDAAIAAWKQFVIARQGYGRLANLFTHFPEKPERFALPPPKKFLVLQDVTVGAPGTMKPIIKRASMRLDAGQGLGIIGPSAAGKSTLGRAMVGIWQPLAGKVMLDGASLDQWEPEALGPSIGYLPQDVQLFDGTVADNISRFAANPNPHEVIAAAEAAGFHSHVLAFPQGYETRIGTGGIHFSAGQKQRIGLARSLYNNPFLVVLDEPNANLDQEGEVAVANAIQAVRNRGGIAIVVAHRPSAIAACDLLMVLRNGEISEFGPKEKVLEKTVANARQIMARGAQRPEGLKVVQGTGPEGSKL